MARDGEVRKNGDQDVAETREWLDSLTAVLQNEGPERARFLLTQLKDKAEDSGVQIPFSLNTPYINTIPPDKQPPFPGSRETERRIKSLARWNAMALVVRANKKEPGIGGHISTYASAATLLRSPPPTSPAPPPPRAAAIRSISRATPPPASTPGRSSKGV